MNLNVKFPKQIRCETERDFHEWVITFFDVFDLGIVRKSSFHNFPDIISIKNGKEIRIEVETHSSNFIKHKHDITKVDYIICMLHDKTLGKPTIKVENSIFNPTITLRIPTTVYKRYKCSKKLIRYTLDKSTLFLLTQTINDKIKTVEATNFKIINYILKEVLEIYKRAGIKKYKIAQLQLAVSFVENQTKFFIQLKKSLESAEQEINEISDPNNQFSDYHPFLTNEKNELKEKNKLLEKQNESLTKLIDELQKTEKFRIDGYVDNSSNLILDGYEQNKFYDFLNENTNNRIELTVGVGKKRRGGFK